MPVGDVYERLRREAESLQLSEAERVLASLRHFNRAARGGAPEVQILNAWSDSPSSVCAIYRVGSGSQQYGLRRQFPPYFTGTPESTGDSMEMDMEEPLGAVRTTVDGRGVIWHGQLSEPLPVAP